MTVLVDSDILIDVSRGKDSNIAIRWTGLSQSDEAVLYCPVTAAELWAGARPNEYANITALLEALVCVPIDRAVGRMAGNYMRQYKDSHGVKLADALIASCAVLNNAVLWTRNLKHYPMKEISFF